VAEGIFAIGDCTASAYAPTAQVASQQGAYLGRFFNHIGKGSVIEAKLRELEANASQTSDKGATDIEAEKAKLSKQLERLATENWKPFHYSHQGSLAYIGSDKAIADLPFPFINGSVSARAYLLVVDLIVRLFRRLLALVSRHSCSGARHIFRLYSP
jgi:NADH:ubiquinone reductase (non-electrogenic)